MTVTNLNALAGSGYLMDGPERNIGARRILRYGLSNSGSIDSAHNSIQALINQNPHLLLLNRLNPGQTLRDLISSCRYLVINGNTLCLTNKGKAPSEIDLICQDIFFSEALIEEPIKCSKGHVFEKKFIEQWIYLKGDGCCPQGQHPVNLIDDMHLKKEIIDKINAYRSSTNSNNGFFDRINTTISEGLRQIKPCLDAADRMNLERPSALVRSYSQILSPILVNILNPFDKSDNPLLELTLREKNTLLSLIATLEPISELKQIMGRIPRDILQEVLTAQHFDQRRYNLLLEKYKLFISEVNTTNSNAYKINYFFRIIEGLEGSAAYFIPDHAPAHIMEAAENISKTAMITSALFHSFPWGALSVVAGIGAYGLKKIIINKPTEIPPATNLTVYISPESSFPLLGRDEIIDQVFNSWRSTGLAVRQHPLLVGSAGVGKSVIIQEIARRIALFGNKLKLPDSLKNAYMYSCTAADLLPKDPYENKFDRFFNTIQKIKNEVIVSIDEIHTFFTDTHKNTFGEKMKPILDTSMRGVPYMIFATTRREYDQYISSDDAIARRFNVITVDILDKKCSIAALRQQIWMQFPGLVYDLKDLDYVYEQSQILANKDTKFQQPEISKQVLSRAIGKIQGSFKTPPSQSILNRKDQEIGDRLARINRYTFNVTDDEEIAIAEIKKLQLERKEIEGHVQEESSKLQTFNSLVNKIEQSMSRVMVLVQKMEMGQQLTESEEKECKFICNIVAPRLLLEKVAIEKELKVTSLNKQIIDSVIAEIEAGFVSTKK